MVRVILHLRGAVEQLYAAPTTRFTALRAELVKQARDAGDKPLAESIGRLRKPTVAAGALNHFVRTQPEGLGELRSFAELMREAQRTLDADQLRLLGRQRANRVDAAAEAVALTARESGQALGGTVLQEVRETLVALIADEEAEASVLTGALVRALAYSGFGSVDIDDVVAVGDWSQEPVGGADDGSAVSPTARPRPDLEVLQGGGQTIDLDERRAARRTARREQLAVHLGSARDELRSADRRVAVLTARHEEVTEGIADLERRLQTARDRLGKVGVELDEASSTRDVAERAEREAQAALDAADSNEDA